MVVGGSRRWGITAGGERVLFEAGKGMRSWKNLLDACGGLLGVGILPKWLVGLVVGVDVVGGIVYREEPLLMISVEAIGGECG